MTTRRRVGDERLSAPINVCITGGGGGIGRAVAAHFHQAGANVAVGDLDAGAASEAAIGLGGSAIGLGLDVRDVCSFAAFLDQAERVHGPLDVLVNNAGVVWTGLFHEQPAEAMRREVEVNLLGVALGSQQAVQRMLPRGRGHVVNLSSGAGLMPFPGAAVYSATKHGIGGLTESLRLAYGDLGIRFTVVYPGQVETPMLAAFAPSSRIPVISADDVAKAVVRAVERDRPEVHVPRSGGPSSRLLAVLPRRSRDAVLRWTGMFELAGGGDPRARRTYQSRSFGSPAGREDGPESPQ